jgi:hypothetical protein
MRNIYVLSSKGFWKFNENTLKKKVSNDIFLLLEKIPKQIL